MELVMFSVFFSVTGVTGYGAGKGKGQGTQVPSAGTHSTQSIEHRLKTAFRQLFFCSFWTFNSWRAAMNYTSNTASGSTCMEVYGR